MLCISYLFAFMYHKQKLNKAALKRMLVLALSVSMFVLFTLLFLYGTDNNKYFAIGIFEV